MSDVANAFVIKLWWRFREQKSLWAKFLYSKYCGARHPSNIQKRDTASKIWSNMLKARDIAETHIRWVVGNGDINAGKDRWLLAHVPHINVQVKEFFHLDGAPNEEKIHMHLGTEALNEIKTLGIRLKADDDKCIWSLNTKGTFSLSSAWELVRQRSLRSMVAKHCWHPDIQGKISIFLWKLLNNGLPTDLAVANKGVQMVSKCLCCKNIQSSEYNTHLFIHSEVAKEIWKCFPSLMNIDISNCVTTAHILSVWWNNSSGNSIHSWMLRLVPAFILWEI